MNDMERRNFEDAFKDAFQGAEQSPSENVWTNIELELERAETGKVKRRLLFYQVLAAASISFAVIMAGVGYYALNSNSPQTNLATNTTAIEQNGTAQDQNLDHNQNQNQNQNQNSGTTQTEHHLSALNEAETNLQPSTSAKSTRTDIEGQQHEVRGSANVVSGSVATKGEELVQPSVSETQHESKLAVANSTAQDGSVIKNSGVGNTTNNAPALVNSDDDRIATNFLRQRPLPELYVMDPVSITLKTEEESIADPVALMFQRLNDLERQMRDDSEKREKKSQAESLWTSVAFSAGNYNAGSPDISQNPGMANASITNAIAYNSNVSNQTGASGVSYSFGMAVGKRISGRWVLQSGLNYMNNSSDYTSNQVVHSEDFKNFKAATLTDLRTSADAENNVLRTAEYTVNSSLEYLSIPVQAGFIAIDRKLGLQFNAGVSTDLFIKNTIDPEGSSIQSTQIGRGSESPYRATNFSGLVNTELSYKFAARYRLSLNPGIRYPFNSIYKEESGISAAPLIFDVGVRFRYIFN